MRGDCSFVNIGGIDDHYSINFPFIIYVTQSRFTETDELLLFFAVHITLWKD